jgi:hypothetical protein
MTHPIRVATRDPTCDAHRDGNLEMTDNLERNAPDVRALIPIPRDPLEVEVDGRPENVGDPCTVILLWSKKPIGILK